MDVIGSGNGTALSDRGEFLWIMFIFENVSQPDRG